MRSEPHFRATEGPPDSIVSVVLADRRRRRVVDALADLQPPVSVERLAAAVADREPGETPASPDDVAVSLHHVHLPKLAAVDVVDYDPETTTVTGERTARLGPLAAAERR